MNNFSRRKLLLLMASLGGSTAVYNTALALGLVQAPSEKYRKIQVKPATKGQEKVVILGGGIGGLCTAYELERAGYQCTILEASHRVGGRNLTLRHGDFIDELGNPNYCQFDAEPNLFFNSGPARIPGHHRRLLAYCKKLGVALHIRADKSRMAYCHDAKALGGRPIRIGQYLTDARGYIAELVQKGVSEHVFDEKLSKSDLEKLADFAKVFGDLGKNGLYHGSGRAGSKTDRMLQEVETLDPLKFSELLNMNQWQALNASSEYYDWSAPLMEPIGGMDKIVDGFVKHIESPIILNAQVQQFALSEDGVTVHYQHKNKIRQMSASYCFNNIPSHLISGIDHNLPQELSSALGALQRGHLFKIAFQMKKRFWEEEGIYGGISYTSQDIDQLWYPSHDIHGEKGIMLGAYSWNKAHNLRYEAMTLEQRLSEAAKAGNNIHPNYSSYIESGASVMWSRMNHMMGCGAHIPGEKKDKFIEILQSPEGRHFMIGDQVTRHSGWQEGALASVENALYHFNKTRIDTSV